MLLSGLMGKSGGLVKGGGLLYRSGWMWTLARRLRRRFWSGEDPRWQGHVVRPLLQSMSRRRVLPFDATLRFEWITRSLIGQPLSLRAWHRMTLNDKVTYRRLRVRDPSFEVFSDRLAMREFVADRLGQTALPELLEVADRAAAFAQRVGPFVIKANHGSGMVNLVQPGERLSSAELARADEWLVIDYAWDDLEWGYLDARRLLLAEEFLRVPVARRRRTSSSSSSTAWSRRSRCTPADSVTGIGSRCDGRTGPPSSCPARPRSRKRTRP